MAALIQHGSFKSLSVVPSASAVKRHPALKGLKRLGEVDNAARSAQPVPVDFPLSAQARGLAIKSLKLTEGFEGFLENIWNKNNEVYFVSWAWDLSGEKVFQHPGVGADAASVIIPMKVGNVREFLGKGINLFPARTVKAGLAVRIMIWESDQKSRDFGKAMVQVSDEINKSDLTNLLNLIALTSGVPGATVVMVEKAALELAKVIGTVLAHNSDDYVDYFEGYYPASDPWTVGEEHHTGNSSEIVLSRTV